MLALGGVEVDWIVVLLGFVNLGIGWFSSEQLHSLEIVHRTRFNGRGPDSSLKRF